MESTAWIRNLVISEKTMEEQGLVNLGDIAVGISPEEETVDFLKDLKLTFLEATSSFNELKNSPDTRIKTYGIANTTADFMLFRNGYKMIFSANKAGHIRIYCQYQQKKHSESLQPNHQEVHITAQQGAFGETLVWTYQDKEVSQDTLVRYFLSRFAKDSLF